MYRASDLINLPVAEAPTGEVISTIKTILFDIGSRSIFSLVCKESLLNKSLCMIKLTDAVSLDKNRLLIKDRSAIIKYKQIKQKLQQLSYFENIIDKVIINNTGDVLGAVKDILFEEQSGRIEYYEVSEGFIDDITKGRCKLDSSRIDRYSCASRQDCFTMRGNGSDKLDTYYEH